MRSEGCCILLFYVNRRQKIRENAAKRTAPFERKNRFESCSFLVHFARNHTFLAVFLCKFTRKTRLSYTRKHNPTPNPTPEIISDYLVFRTWV